MWTHLIHVTVYFAIEGRCQIKQRNQPGLLYKPFGLRTIFVFLIAWKSTIHMKFLVGSGFTSNSIQPTWKTNTYFLHTCLSVCSMLLLSALVSCLSGLLALRLRIPSMYVCSLFIVPPTARYRSAIVSVFYASSVAMAARGRWWVCLCRSGQSGGRHVSLAEYGQLTYSGGGGGGLCAYPNIRIRWEDDGGVVLLELMRI